MQKWSKGKQGNTRGVAHVQGCQLVNEAGSNVNTSPNFTTQRL